MIDGWRSSGVPHRGWVCIDVEDLGEPEGNCDMCETEIRYVHVMRHPQSGDIRVGCICAGHMERDYAAPLDRERRLKNRSKRRERWLTRRWLESRAGNYRLRLEGRLFGVFRDPDYPGLWKGRIDDMFGRKRFATPDAVKLALFDFVYPIRDIITSRRQGASS
jgi:hypothetical protein